MHGKFAASPEPAPPRPPPWFAGAAIGLAILGMAGNAVVLGSTMALTRIGCGLEK